MRPVTRGENIHGYQELNFDAQEDVLNQFLTAKAYAELRRDYIVSFIQNWYTDSRQPAAYTAPGDLGNVALMTHLTAQADTYFQRLLHAISMVPQNTISTNPAIRQLAKETSFFLKQQIATYDAIAGTVVLAPLDATYNTAVYPLQQALGNYCSYCEVKTQLIQVEHILPKSWFPKEYVKWDNFLLACNFCNSNKGTKPSRPAGIWSIINGNLALPAPPEQAIRRATLDLYCWPNEEENFYYQTFNNAFQYVLNQVFYDMNNERSAEPLPLPNAPALIWSNKLTLADQSWASNGPYVIANIGDPSDPSTLIPINIELHIENNSVPDFARRAINLIENLNLNRSHGETVPGSPRDIRVADRTRMFFYAMDALKGLAYAQNDGEITRLIQANIKTIIAGGFWTVWWMVLSLLTGNDAITAMRNALYKAAYFPGTRIPTINANQDMQYDVTQADYQPV